MIEVRNVSVRYIMGDFKDIGLKEYLIRRLNGQLMVKDFWALDDVSFYVEKGTLLGIIGSNGSGKSTILKILAEILPPTKGTVKINGVVAPLLELGAGFDGELTVKENVFLRGALMGYTKEFIIEEYFKIIEFAELGQFQDIAFKKLSSGMKSRLAFSLASRVCPDILILDEVLSVGDIAFRKKSEKCMRNLMADGTTTILVSHSISQIKQLCTQVLWLEKGKVMGIGDTKTLCNDYESYMNKLK